MEPTPQVSYLTQDHLGSPRVITNENGVVTSRKDFMAYGEEAASANRVSGSGGNGYDPAGTRKDYTGHEKDSETGLEYAQARYYNPTHGRYTSIDPMTASATIKNPQTFNRYSYVLNSPYKFVDPLGLISSFSGSASGGYCGVGYSSCEGDYQYDLTGANTTDEKVPMDKKTKGEVVSKIYETAKLTVYEIGSSASGRIVYNLIEEYDSAVVSLTDAMSAFLDEKGNIIFDSGITEASLFNAARIELQGLIDNMNKQDGTGLVLGAEIIRLKGELASAELGKPIAEITGMSARISSPLGGGGYGDSRSSSGAVASYNAALASTTTNIDKMAAKFSSQFANEGLMVSGRNDSGRIVKTQKLLVEERTLQNWFRNRMEIARVGGRSYVAPH